MKYQRGDRVNPVICPEIKMLVDTVQIGAEYRYHRHWFVDGEIKDSWFNDIELQFTENNDAMGFKKGNNDVVQ